MITSADGLESVSETARRATMLLGELIAFESISARSNLDIVAHVQAFLAGEGIAARIIPNATGEKAALLATIGPADRPGVILSAHTDVVPVAGQDWSVPPFQATERDGRIHGRGATDMKGFVACVLAAVPALRAAATATPVHIAFSFDEELGCLGVDGLLAEIGALPVRPALCIVGEPTGMRVVRGHKGKLARRVTIFGRGGHSALPHRAANALYAAAEIVTGLRALAAECAAKADAPDYDPPYTTVHVGSLHAGGALNLVPDRAVLEFEIRSVAGTDVGALLERIDALIETAVAPLRAVAPEARTEITDLGAYPALDLAADRPEIAFLQSLAGTAEPAGTVAFGTEAGLYAAAGIPTLVCGPGDIARAHKADEWIGTDELHAACAMLSRLAGRLHTPIDAQLQRAAFPAETTD